MNLFLYRLKNAQSEGGIKLNYFLSEPRFILTFL
jgi:hypothetical protein